MLVFLQSRLKLIVGDEALSQLIHIHAHNSRNKARGDCDTNGKSIFRHVTANGPWDACVCFSGINGVVTANQSQAGLAYLAIFGADLFGGTLTINVPREVQNLG